MTEQSPTTLIRHEFFPSEDTSSNEVMGIASGFDGLEIQGPNKRLYEDCISAIQDRSTAFLPARQLSDIRMVGVDSGLHSVVVTKSDSMESRLFDALANAKILTSQIAMHLDRAWRDKLFAYLDWTHEPADWDEGEQLLDPNSFRCFLRFWTKFKPKKNPNFGISVRGNFVSYWENDFGSLRQEYFPQDLIHWHLRIDRNGWEETAGGRTKLMELGNRHRGFRIRRWLDGS